MRSLLATTAALLVVSRGTTQTRTPRPEPAEHRGWRAAGPRRIVKRAEAGVPNGIRTRVAALKGRCPRPARRWGRAAGRNIPRRSGLRAPPPRVCVAPADDPPARRLGGPVTRVTVGVAGRTNRVLRAHGAMNLGAGGQEGPMGYDSRFRRGCPSTRHRRCLAERAAPTRSPRAARALPCARCRRRRATASATMPAAACSSAPRRRPCAVRVERGRLRARGGSAPCPARHDLPGRRRAGRALRRPACAASTTSTTTRAACAPSRCRPASRRWCCCCAASTCGGATGRWSRTTPISTPCSRSGCC